MFSFDTVGNKDTVGYSPSVARRASDVLPIRRLPVITVILDRESKARLCIRLSSSISFVRLQNFILYYGGNYYRGDKITKFLLNFQI